jgi:hypothetical protein
LSLLLLFVYQGEGFVSDVIFEDLLDILVQLATIVLIVALVHHYFVNFDVLLGPGHKVVVASKEAEDPINIVLLN